MEPIKEHEKDLSEKIKKAVEVKQKAVDNKTLIKKNQNGAG